MPNQHPSDATAATVRILEGRDISGFVDLLISEGETLGGSPSQHVIRSVASDAASNRGALITVADLDGRTVGAMVSLVGGAPTYWRHFMLRHPKAGADLIARRLRKRIRSAFRKQRTARTTSTPPKQGLPDDLRSDPRLHIPAPPGATVNSTYRGTGSHVAYGPLVVVASDQRGRGIAQRLHAVAFTELALLGVTTYTNSFLLDYEPSIRLYLRLGFTIYRFPFGFFGTFDIGRASSSIDDDGGIG